MPNTDIISCFFFYFWGLRCRLQVLCRLETKRNLMVCQRFTSNVTQSLILSTSHYSHWAFLLLISPRIAISSLIIYAKSDKSSLNYCIVNFCAHCCIVCTQKYFLFHISLRSWDVFFKFLHMPSLGCLMLAEMW